MIGDDKMKEGLYRPSGLGPGPHALLVVKVNRFVVGDLLFDLPAWSCFKLSDFKSVLRCVNNITSHAWQIFVFICSAHIF
jgi:hypothetical protein